ncbi:hypothetical protein [Methylobacterium sp. Leaf456]|uniref:hypothetical protein n=1 Tax=Methylobacterium sp. Leaf456 TaxID=1736382 RepID=UPI000A659312|nr:hypothetical protein [Methylobacterium sp. Leaf456]
MLTDTELVELARAVAALDDEDAGRLDEAVRERRREIWDNSERADAFGDPVAMLPP